MDLMTLNNQIVAMRALVRRAKVQVVRKLVRNLQKFRKKNGTENQKEKNQRKADRLLLEIADVKRINLDVVSKYAVTNTHVQVTEKEMTPKGLILKRLSAFKPITEAVTSFREKYPQWETELAVLLKMKDVRNKYKKDIKNNKKAVMNKNNKKAVMNKNNKKAVMNKNKVPVKPRRSQSQKDSEITEGHSEMTEKMQKSSEIDEGKIKLHVVNTNVVKGKTKAALKSVSESNDERINKKPTVQLVVKEKVEGEMEIKKLNLEDWTKEVIDSNVDKKKGAFDDINTNFRVPCVKDNFFLTSDNSDEESANDAEGGDVSINSDELSPKLNEAVDCKNKNTRFSTEISRKSHSRNHHEKELKRNFPYPKRNPSGKSFDKKFHSPLKNALSVKTRGDPENEMLHPSWQAKRIMKNQNTIQEFKGKKIVFDD